jgi:Zn-dependent M28 family amino/carboxypeptidase
MSRVRRCVRLPRAGLLAGALALALLLPAQALRAQLPAWPDTATLMRAVRVLAADSMEGRRAGSAGGARARRYLLERLRMLHLAPWGTSYEHAFPLAGDGVAGVNLVAVIPGQNSRHIVLSAHYDHVGIVRGEIYNGADDNASGVAGVLAIAEELQRRPLKHSVLIVLFDGEEAGLLGAKAMLAEARRRKAALALEVNLDMVGHSEKGELWAAGAGRYPILLPPLKRLQARAPVRLLLGHDRPGAAGQDDWTNQSDQGPFHAAGIPFVYFGVEDHKDYHRPSDDPDTMTPAFFGRAVATVLLALRSLDAVVR